ncbi:MAG TPA: glycosyltransferase [Acidimicrobiia bacterium]|nr:glycosyltransferase [Acidimicrobiia bacterium]
MRIALISEHASPLAKMGSVDAGGQNVYVREVASSLAAAGHTIDVFTRRDAEDLSEIVEVEPGLRVVHVPAGPAEPIPKEELTEHMAAFAAWMRNRMDGYDIAHANFFMSGMVARDLKRWLGLPFVVTFHALGAVRVIHQGDSDRFPGDRVKMEQSVMDEATAIIAECPQDEADLMRWYDVPRSRIVTIPCGVDTDVFRPVGRSLARARKGWDEDEWIILHVGRMVPRKGVDTVIEALAELRTRGVDNASLVIAGGSSDDPQDDEYVRGLMTLADELGVGDHVRFTGRVDHHLLPQLYGAADVFVTTPWYEPFGITPLEAMACGLPVVGSNVGGIKYTVRDGETGFLVPPRDAQAVADRLQELRTLPWLASTLSENARRRAEDLFTWQKVSDSLMELYEEIVDGVDRVPVASSTPVFGRALEELSGVLMRSGELDVPLMRAGRQIVSCLRNGGRVMVAGNGGSAAQSQHLAAELMGRFLIEGRPALGVVSLNTDTAVITAWANDVGFDDVFARQVEGLGREGDVLVGLSTSGNSANLVRAFDTARDLGITTISLLGGDGGAMVDASDIAIVVPSRNTQRIQEIHVVLIHILSALVESAMSMDADRAPTEDEFRVRASSGGLK